MAKKRHKIKIDDRDCPGCGHRFKRVSGILRCDECGINKKYDVDDGRPREGFGYTRIKPIIRDDI